MTQRETHLLWLKDLVENLRECHDRLEWTADPEAARLLIDGMVRDLERGKKICEAIRVRTPLRSFGERLAIPS